MRYQELYTVVGLQLDEPQPVELEQQLQAFGLVDFVGGDDLLQGNVIQSADGDQEQLGGGNDLLFLLPGELRDQRLLLVQYAREVGQLRVGQLADLVQPLQSEIPPRKHAFDASLAQAQAARHLRIGDTARPELAL